MKNSHTFELSHAYVYGNHVTLYKTITPDFAVYTLVHCDTVFDTTTTQFFEEAHVTAARKAFAATIAHIVGSINEEEST